MPFLTRLAGLYPVVLVTGARQTGKTELVKHTFPDHRWVLLDEHAVLDSATRDPGLFLQNNPAPVIFDEIQKAPALLAEIKAQCDRGVIGRGGVILTGSQPLPLMRNVSETLAGRVGIMDLLPMTLAEIAGSAPSARLLDDWLENPPIGERFEFPSPPVECLLRGGFPAMALSCHSPHADDAATRVSDYVQTYLSRDLRDMSQVQDLGRFARFMRHLAVFSGRLLDLNRVASDIGIPQSTANHWLGLLEASMLVWRIPGWSKHHGKRERKGAKFFFVDSGLQVSLLGYSNIAQLSASPLLGAIYETACAQAMKKIARSNAGAMPLMHWRFKEDHEVDLIVERRHEDLCLCEFKITSNPGPEDLTGIVEFRKHYGVHHKAIVVSTHPVCHWLSKDVLAVPLAAL